MPHFNGEEQIAFNARASNSEINQCTAAAQLDPVITLRVAQFAFFLDEIEECSNSLRRDQIEQVIAHAVATCGFANSCEARKALEWMFRQPPTLS